eukprot:scaffold67204_cov30-Tisochrysis_lutea.AAC.5
MVTGEPVPVGKEEGSTVVGGTMNESGVLYVRVTAVGSESVLAKIMQVRWRCNIMCGRALL